MLLKKTILQSLILLSLSVAAAYGEEQGVHPEPADRAVSVCDPAGRGGIFEGGEEPAKESLDDEVLARMDGGADGFLPDMLSTTVAKVVLWDEVKNRRSTAKRDWEGRFTGTIPWKGR